MNGWFTLKDLSGRTWYIQEIIVKDEKDNVLFDGQNSNLLSEVYKPMMERWVYSIGVIDNKMIVKIK